MTPAAFLKLALAMPGATLGSHFGRSDIRVAGKIFATPADRSGDAAVLKLTREQQQMLFEAEPTMFEPGGGRGTTAVWTRFIVAKADAAAARSVLWMAWRNAAPNKMQKVYA